MPELRKDPISNRRVIIAGDRANRPGHSTATAPTEPCPFCAGNEAMTPPEVFAYRQKDTRADDTGWSVRIVTNKYPALLSNIREQECIEGIYEAASADGVHEVVIESAEHTVNMALLSKDDFKTVLHAYRDRLRQLRSEGRWHYLLLYKNQGVQAGATLEHVHSQIVALPAIPKQATDEIENNQKHFERYGRCLSCEMIEQERVGGQRIIVDDEHFIAFCPFASRFAYESWILPKRHAASFEHGSEEDLIHLAGVMREILMRLDRGVNHPSFNYVIHTAPGRGNETGDYHWRIEILPRVNQPAGFEWGSGYFINPVGPEAAARVLRGVGL